MESVLTAAKEEAKKLVDETSSSAENSQYTLLVWTKEGRSD